MIRQVTHLVRNSGEIPWVSVRSFLLFRVASVQGKDEVSWEEKCTVWTPALPRPFLVSCIHGAALVLTFHLTFKKTGGHRDWESGWLSVYQMQTNAALQIRKLKPREVPGRLGTQTWWGSSPHSCLFWESQAWLKGGHDPAFLETHLESTGDPLA